MGTALSIGLVVCLRGLQAQQLVSIAASDGGTLHGDLYGSGDRGVVLVAHGGYSHKALWEEQARALAQNGFRVLAFDTRAGEELRRTGKESSCLYDPACMAQDVLAAVRYLRRSGATTVAVVGGSAGGGAAAQASVDASPAEIDSIVLLAPMSISTPERMKGRKLFITARDDRNAEGPRLPAIRSQYDEALNPKEFLIFEGSAHGQRIFDTPQGPRLLSEIVRFLSER